MLMKCGSPLHKMRGSVGGIVPIRTKARMNMEVLRLLFKQGK